MQIQGYNIVRPLGEGGMSVVYLAVQEALNREVAIKVLRRPANDDGSITDRFLNEAQTIARLHHPNIVAIFDFGQTEDGSFFYCMPLLTQGDLAGYRYSDDPALRRIVCQVCAGLSHAHRQGIVHRDIKPENILFDLQGHALIADFGIAFSTRSRDVRVTKEGHTVGSSQHMSPEQARGEPVDARSDLYSLGVVLFEMLTGRPPFDGPDDISILVSQVSDPVPRLPPELRHWQPVVDRALAKSPKDRFQTAAEMGRAVERVRPSPLPGWLAAATASPLRWIAAGAAGLLAAGWWLVASMAPEPGPPVEVARQIEEPVSEPAVTPILASEDLDRRLGDAYGLIETGQLLAPAGDNALDRFLDVMAIYPQSAEARAGVEAVIERIDASLEGALAVGNPEAMEPALADLDSLAGRPALRDDPLVLAIRDRVNRAVIDRLEQSIQRQDRTAAEAWLVVGTRIEPEHPAYLRAPSRIDALAEAEVEPSTDPDLSFVSIPWEVNRPDGRPSSRLDHGFALSIREITVAQYREFAESTGRPASRCRSPGDPVSMLSNATWQFPGFTQGDDHPVVCVSHRDAEAFARWISERTGQRLRLPTEAEWRHAASAAGRVGNACQSGNVAGQELDRVLRGRNYACRDGFEHTGSVASFEPNPLGVHDLDGNVSEWVSDCAPEQRGIDKLLGKLRISDRDRCDRRVVLGNSWRDGPSRTLLQPIDPVDRDIGMTTIGFRLVWDRPEDRSPASVE